jgi:DNA-binding transcriptional regulator GbsR (MarR family)
MASAAEPKLRPRSKVPGLSWTLVRSEGRPREVVAFEEEVVAFFLDSANLLGVPKSLAAIYGICFASPEPLSFTEVQERLDLSSGSISQGLRILREVGALKVVKTEMDSREFLTPDLELRKLIQHWLTERLQRQLTAGQGRLQTIEKTLPGGRTPSAKVLRARIKSLQGWHDKASSILPFVRTALKLG